MAHGAALRGISQPLKCRQDEEMLSILFIHFLMINFTD